MGRGGARRMARIARERALNPTGFITTEYTPVVDIRDRRQVADAYDLARRQLDEQVPLRDRKSTPVLRVIAAGEALQQLRGKGDDPSWQRLRDHLRRYPRGGLVTATVQVHPEAAQL